MSNINRILLITASLNSFSVLALPAGVAPTPIFSDDFSSAMLDDSKWEYRQLGKRNYCINTHNAVISQGEYLTIRTYSEKDSQNKLQNYCGMISTDKRFLFTYGYWEADVRFKRAKGVQVAFWIQSPTMGSDISNPEKSGVEIDVFEHLAEASQESYDHAIHWNGYGAEHKSWAIKKSMDALADDEFHRFGVLWTQSGYQFYIDDVLAEVAPSHVPISVAPSYIILSSEVPRSGFPVNGYGDRESADTDFDIKSIKVYPLVDHMTWKFDKYYYLNDIVNYQDTLYRCIDVHQANHIDTPDISHTQWEPINVAR